MKEIKSTLHINKAAVCDKQGRLDDSIEQCTKALELRPHNVKALFRRGDVTDLVEVFLLFTSSARIQAT